MLPLNSKHLQRSFRKFDNDYRSNLLVSGNETLFQSVHQFLLLLLCAMPDKSPPTTHNTFTRGCIAFQTDSHCNPISIQQHQAGRIVLVVPYVAIKWHKQVSSSSKAAQKLIRFFSSQNSNICAILKPLLHIH